MIVDLKKFLFIGTTDEIDRFFEKAQDQGFLEFLSVGPKKEFEHPQDIQNLILAIKALRKLPVKKAYHGGADLHFAHQIAERILHLKDEIEKLSEQERLLEAEISRVGIFGDFSMEDLDYIEKEGKRKIQFFCMKTSKREDTAIPTEMIYVGTQYDLDYFIAINPEPRTYPGMIEIRIDRPLGELQNQLSFVKDTHHQLEAELKGFAGHIHFLQDALVEDLNEYNLHHAKHDLTYPLGDSIFAIEAWAAENKINSLYGLLDGMAIHCEQIAIEPTDKVPTCLENKGAARIGEDLVKIYDTPSIKDKDPSLWVLCAFAFFFSMIINDAGYGLLYLSVALLIKYKVKNLKGMGKRLLKLFIILSTGCIVWGTFFTASFFGLKIPPTSFFGKISIIDYLAEKKAIFLHTATGAKDISADALTLYSRDILLELSLIIGIIHISAALIRNLRRSWAGIGWILFIIGGYLYFPIILKANSLVQFLGLMDQKTAGDAGLQLIYIGLGTVFVLAFIQNKWGALKEIANLIQVFADVLSYLRLYALGLAGAIMAETFNGIGDYIGPVAGIIAIVVGHLVNIILSAGSGVIHGLRLNFIEWYHFCFEGGGRLFKPLTKLKPK